MDTDIYMVSRDGWIMLYKRIEDINILWIVMMIREINIINKK